MPARRKARILRTRAARDVARRNAPANLLLATRTLSALAVVLKRAGLSIREIEIATAAAVSAAASASAKHAEIPIAKDSALLGSALTTWHRDPNYVDRNGVPKPLTLYGKRRSVQALLIGAGLSNESRKSAMFLRDAGLLLPAGRGRFVPTGRSARMPDINTYFIEHIALGVMKFMQTVQHNFTPSGKRTPLLQRAAAVRHLPTRHHAAFRDYVNEQGNAFVTNVDDWLEARATKGRNGHQSPAPAGVYAFAYLD